MKRRPTRSVRVGNLVIGSEHPVVIQSMTTTTPEDVAGSLSQIAALQEAGCPLVRLAVPSVRAAKALASLRRAMAEQGLEIPLIADVHFSPAAALEAAQHAQKVRINPGNFAPAPGEIRPRLTPLLDLLARRGASLRIGVNHGSLAPHIAERHGHGPEGMVHSALEYLRICREAGFEEIVVALKASNPVVMIAANRLLAERMREESFDQPIHLGVTEAGAGAEGALRSAVGISTLLTEGIGDTIRVSLTGDPVQEIAVCRRIVSASAAAARDADGVGAAPPAPEAALPPIAATWGSLAVGGTAPPRVELPLSLSAERPHLPDQLPAMTAAPGEKPESLLLRWAGDFDAATTPQLCRCLGDLRQMAQRMAGPAGPPAIWLEPEWTLFTRALGREADPERAASAPELPEWLSPLLSAIDGLCISIPHPAKGPSSDLALLAAFAELRPELLMRYHLESPPAPSQTAALLAATERARLPLPCFSSRGRALAPTLRALATQLRGPADAAGRRRPLLAASLPRDPWAAAARVGPLLLEGIVDVVIAEDVSRPPSTEQGAGQGGDDVGQSGPAAGAAEGLSPLARGYALLQATRRRLTRAEFISCPGCGRLSYDLDTAVRRVKARFGHLPDLKIAIMGCVVNGPGEMADADFGYVGSSRGLVDLYVGTGCVRRGLTPQAADDLLVQLLRERGRWTEPS